MKKYIFMAAAMLLAMASCTNEVEEQTVAKKKTVTLTATLSNGDETRATYVDNNGLKATWDATETITVLSLDASNNIIHKDNLTSTGAAGRTSAEFTGTITEDANTKKYICYYPALGGVGNTVTVSTLPTQYLNWDLGSQFQNQDGDLARVAQKSVYNGVATFEGSNMTVNLQAQLTVFKLVLTMPDDVIGNSCSGVSISSSRNVFGYGSWYYAYETTLGISGSGCTAQANVSLSTPKEITAGDKTVTAYILARMSSDGVQAGDTWTISAAGKSKTLTWKNDKVFEKGKMYTINATLE